MIKEFVSPGQEQASVDRTSQGSEPAEWGTVCGEVLENIKSDVEQFLKVATDNVYERLLYNVQDYLTDNLAYNIQSKIDSADREAKAALERAAAAEEKVAALLKALRSVAGDPGENPCCAYQINGVWVQSCDCGNSGDLARTQSWCVEANAHEVARAAISKAMGANGDQDAAAQ